MATKREIAELLTTDELRAVVDRFELEVDDRRARGGMVDAIVTSRKVDLKPVLAELAQKRLKELCRKLDLDRSGRDKAALVARLLGTELSPAPNGRANGKPSGKDNGVAAAPNELPAGGKLTVDQLERYLWSAADILRGSIDSSDYKSFYDERRGRLGARGAALEW